MDNVEDIYVDNRFRFTWWRGIRCILLLQRYTTTYSSALENNAKLEVAAQLQEETINTMIEDREKFEQINKELQKELQTAERYGDQLRATLQKHNLTHLANKKPGMIEKRMQNATNRLWDCLTDITDPEWVRMAARKRK